MDHGSNCAGAVHSARRRRLPGGEQGIEAIDAGILKSADLNNDGEISRRENIHFTDLVFLSMDTDGSDILTQDEFLQWDPGYVAVAEQLGKMEQFNAAKKEVYGSRDLNGDGGVDHDEFSVSSLYDFYKADVNHNRTLSRDEFIGEFRILKQIHAAIS